MIRFSALLAFNRKLARLDGPAFHCCVFFPLRASRCVHEQIDTCRSTATIAASSSKSTSSRASLRRVMKRPFVLARCLGLFGRVPPCCSRGPGAIRVSGGRRKGAPFRAQDRHRASDRYVMARLRRHRGRVFLCIRAFGENDGP